MAKKQQITANKSKTPNKPAPLAPPAPRVVSMTRDQQRAAWAYKVLEGPAALANAADLTTLAKGLPATLLRSGLLGALAFTMRYRNAAVRGVVLDALVTGLRDQLTTATIPAEVTGSGLAKHLVSQTQDRGPSVSEDDYILASREAILLATWLKRAVEGDERFKKEEGSDAPQAD